MSTNQLAFGDAAAGQVSLVCILTLALEGVFQLAQVLIGLFIAVTGIIQHERKFHHNVLKNKCDQSKDVLCMVRKCRVGKSHDAMFLLLADYS